MADMVLEQDVVECAARALSHKGDMMVKSSSERDSNQVTVYLKQDVVGPFYEFKSKYLDLTATAIINAALRYYLPVVLRNGADGALQPLGLTITEDTRETFRELIHEALSKRMGDSGGDSPTEGPLLHLVTEGTSGP